MEPFKLFKALVEQAPDAVIFADTQGLIRIWNLGAEAIFGYSAAEALGQSLDLIVPEDLRKAHWSGYELAIKAGHTKYGHKVMTTRSCHKSGGRIYVNLSFAVVRNGAGGALGAMAHH